MGVRPLAMLLVTIPAVALGLGACWVELTPARTRDEEALSGLVAALAAMVQLFLSTVALCWAGIWSSESPAKCKRASFTFRET